MSSDPDRERRSIAGRNRVGSAANLLEALLVFGERKSVSLADVQDRVGVSSTTAYRLLSTLEAAGFVERAPRHGYRAGAVALTWAANLLSHLDVRTVARPVLERMPTLPGEAIYLAVVREAGLVAVDILHADTLFSVLPEPLAEDMRVPVHATALGHVVAIHLEPARLAGLLGPEPYESWTPHTPGSWQELSRFLDAARARGFGLMRDGVTLGVTGIAAPIFAGRTVVGAVSITGPTSDLDGPRVETAAIAVRGAAAEISHLLSTGEGGERPVG